LRTVNDGTFENMETLLFRVEIVLIICFKMMT